MTYLYDELYFIPLSIIHHYTMYTLENVINLSLYFVITRNTQIQIFMDLYTQKLGPGLNVLFAESSFSASFCHNDTIQGILCNKNCVMYTLENVINLSLYFVITRNTQIQIFMDLYTQKLGPGLNVLFAESSFSASFCHNDTIQDILCKKIM